MGRSRSFAALGRRVQVVHPGAFNVLIRLSCSARRYQRPCMPFVFGVLLLARRIAIIVSVRAWICG
jgi:hypothetical protein